MTDKQRVLLRADGKSTIGLGHIVRCCALAEMLKDNFEIYFYTRAGSEIIVEDIKQYCVDVFEMTDNISYDDEASDWVSVLEGNEIVVLDGYNFNTNYQQKIKEKGCKLVCIDDIHAYHFVADTVINHSPGIDENLYSREPYTQLYLGTGYVLLRKIFLEEASKPHKFFNTERSSVLICFGGADPKNITKEVLEETMHLFPDKNIIVVVGAAYIYLQELREIIKVNKQVSLHINIKPEEMLAIMQQSHIAITSASTIALEYICVKGNLFLEQTAENQKYLYKALIEKTCAYPFASLKDCFYVTDNITNQHNLIDGKSSEKLRNIFSSLKK